MGMTDTTLNRILTPSARLVLASTASGIFVTLVHEDAPSRPLAYGLGATLDAALVSLDKQLNRRRTGPHVGGE